MGKKKKEEVFVEKFVLTKEETKQTLLEDIKDNGYISKYELEERFEGNINELVMDLYREGMYLYLAIDSCFTPVHVSELKGFSIKDLEIYNYFISMEDLVKEVA